MGQLKENILVLSRRKYDYINFHELTLNFPEYEFLLIRNKEELNDVDLTQLNPKFIFVTNWSWIIREEITEKYKTILFHMTDLPYGRGGSPLQNLITLGNSETKISAVEMSNLIDAGRIFFKETLDLKGSAQEIYERASKIIYALMIPRLLNEEIIPISQTGKIVEFKRRSPKESYIDCDIDDIRKLYDFVRMLDAEEYPKAYINHGNYRIEFFNSRLEDDTLLCEVKVRKNE
jgi:methionyl-tRNA formyltransferase